MNFNDLSKAQMWDEINEIFIDSLDTGFWDIAYFARNNKHGISPSEYMAYVEDFQDFCYSTLWEEAASYVDEEKYYFDGVAFEDAYYDEVYRVINNRLLDDYILDLFDEWYETRRLDVRA